MVRTCEGPEAHAGADRADVTKLAGQNDIVDPTSTTIELQVRSVLKRYVVSVPLALVIAEAAFSSGRQP